MFTISPAQMNAYEQDAALRFEDEMVAHSRSFSPKLTTVLGESQLRVALRQAMNRAEKYGFTLRGPIRLYIELMFLYGSEFDTDPQYPDIGKELNATDDQMARAERIWQSVVEFIEQVMGANNVNLRIAIEFLIDIARSNVILSEFNFIKIIEQEMNNAFPWKVSYVGKENLVKLIQKGRNEALKYEFTSLRSQALVVVLMFVFGHGCTHDPLYPWISETLLDEHIKDPQSRAKRLEMRALTWLEHVRAGLQKGT